MNAFQNLFSELADPAKLAEFAKDAGESAQANTADREAFVKKAKSEIMLAGAKQALMVLLLDKQGESGFDAEQKLYEIVGMSKREAIEMIAMGQLYRCTSDATLMAVLEARGRKLAEDGMVREVARRWKAAQAEVSNAQGT